jgi:hypothetical protein
MESGLVSRYSGCLRIGRPGFHSWNNQEVFFSIASRSGLGTTQPPVQWAPALYPLE